MNERGKTNPFAYYEYNDLIYAPLLAVDRHKKLIKKPWSPNLHSLSA